MDNPKTLLFANWRECMANAVPGISETEISVAAEIYAEAFEPLPPFTGLSSLEVSTVATNSLLRIASVISAGGQN